VKRRVRRLVSSGDAHVIRHTSYVTGRTAGAAAAAAAAAGDGDGDGGGGPAALSCDLTTNVERVTIAEKAPANALCL